MQRIDYFNIIMTCIAHYYHKLNYNDYALITVLLSQYSTAKLKRISEHFKAVYYNKDITIGTIIDNIRYLGGIK